jgi:hypothetical protein
LAHFGRKVFSSSDILTTYYATTTTRYAKAFELQIELTSTIISEKKKVVRPRIDVENVDRDDVDQALAPVVAADESTSKPHFNIDRTPSFRRELQSK